MKSLRCTSRIWLNERVALASASAFAYLGSMLRILMQSTLNGIDSASQWMRWLWSADADRPRILSEWRETEPPLPVIGSETSYTALTGPLHLITRSLVSQKTLSIYPFNNRICGSWTRAPTSLGDAGAANHCLLIFGADHVTNKNMHDALSIFI